MATYNTFELSGDKSAACSPSPNVRCKLDNANANKYLKRVTYMLSVIIIILLIVCGILLSEIYSEDSNNSNASISVDLIDGLDTYLASHCVLHRDTFEAERMDQNGDGMTTIRNPIQISSPINVAYSPLLNASTGEIEYFTNRDSSGNLVPKPLCQTDFDTSSYTMKNNDYTFDVSSCEFPLPLWMNETDIINLPRRLTAITHRITLTTPEVVGELEEGHTFEFFTYNATVPGPPLRVRVGDWIDLTLINPNTSIHEHSVDFHAMNGPGGGADSLRANPGERARTVWQANMPGMFIYHCASGWASDHIAKGMFGAIIVEPSNGLPYSDMDVYLGQGELYLKHPLVNNMGTKFLRPPPNIHNIFDDIKERYEMSDVVMLNGAPFALVHNPIITTVGSIVRSFIVSGGPNHISSFHLVGDSFDRVWLHGDLTSTPQQNIQTTTVPPGGCAVADWRHDTPGNFIFVDHSLTRAFVRGNLGIIRACNPNDIHCLSGEKMEKYESIYTCNPDRYNNINDTLMGNDDCIFCPWSRDEFKYSTVYNESNEIYNYLDIKCNLSSRIDDIKWQGNETLFNDTVSDIINNWRKNRYPGDKQWSLSDRLSHADPMKGNGRSWEDPHSNDTDFDDSPCIVDVGMDVIEGIEIIYTMDKSGDGEIVISSLYSNVVGGGWIAFGRGGDGISTMTDGHVITVLFDQNLDEIDYVSHYLREYGTPSLDFTDDIFPISNPSVTVDDDKVRFSFDVLSGDWIEPVDLTTVPMIVGIGRTNGGVHTDDMSKHFNKAIIYLNLDADECLLGGSKL